MASTQEEEFITMRMKFEHVIFQLLTKQFFTQTRVGASKNKRGKVYHVLSLLLELNFQGE